MNKTQKILTSLTISATIIITIIIIQFNKTDSPKILQPTKNPIINKNPNINKININKININKINNNNIDNNSVNPVINWTKPWNNKLFPWWNFNLEFNYLDWLNWYWINTNSDNIKLYKWNWTTWNSDISSTKLNILTKNISNTKAIYPTNNLDYWKYKSDFSISDFKWNTWTWSIIFYIDKVNLIISTWSIDLWDIKEWNKNFTPQNISITVETVWAWFNLILNKESPLEYSWVEIKDWNWTNWFWYNNNINSKTINLINSNEIIATQTWSIDINWNIKTFKYNIIFWANIFKWQPAWDYTWKIKFWLDLNY